MFCIILNYDIFCLLSRIGQLELDLNVNLFVVFSSRVFELLNGVFLKQYFVFMQTFEQNIDNISLILSILEEITIRDGVTDVHYLYRTIISTF